ncbi:sigma-70 family RNA polymerase sigma factor [Singulisphaera sp. PoT]|uniref:sigma-70 family RNA polymerase sigma factor n=1 Tax=Singulisphaera sp. PoT TaxID=3411797 RepID=UPI003BF5F790
MTGRPLDANTTTYGPIQTLYAAGTLGNQPDGFLLERFLTAPAAIAQDCFAVLVERHGPMVYRACRQVLGNDHDAQDAFQATFLVLARQASSVRKRDSLGSWLYGIALRIAWRARANRIRHQNLERRVASRTSEAEPFAEASEPGWPELHEEVDRLPRKFRDAVVLCYLEGLTTEAASRRLGCPQGTVLSRLSRARTRLKARLSERGLTIPAGFAAGGHICDLSGTLPLDGAARTLARTAVQILEGDAAIETGSLMVKTLTDGMLKIILRTKIARLTASVLGVGLLIAGIGLFVHATTAAPPGDLQQTPPPKKTVVAPGKPAVREKAGAEGAGSLIVRAANINGEQLGDAFMGLAAIDTDTAKWRTIHRGKSFGRLSPDGRYLLSAPIDARQAESLGMGVWIHDLQGKEAPRRIFNRYGEPYWSHDGRKVVIALFIGENTYENWIVDADGTHGIKLPIPETDFVLDCSRDGTWLATRTLASNVPYRGRHTLVHPDGTSSRRLIEGSTKTPYFLTSRFSPDGRSIACVDFGTEVKARKPRVYVEDLNGQAHRDLSLDLEEGSSVDVTWSPDASRLALAVMDHKTRTSRIAIVNRDGTGFRRLPLPEGEWNLFVLDWTFHPPARPLSDKILDIPVSPDTASPAGRYLALRKAEEAEAKAADDATNRRDAGDKTQVDDSKVHEDRLLKFSTRFLELAEAAPDDPAAFRALIWIAQRCWIGPAYVRAINLLAEKYADQTETARVALMHSRSIFPEDEKLFLAILAANARPRIQAETSLAFGRYLKHRADRIREARACPEWASSMTRLHLDGGTAPQVAAGFFQGDPEDLSKQATAQFERVIRDYSDAPGPEKTLAESARAELHELRDLAVGKPAPEIQGQDLDGKPLRLVQFKGKAIVLIFWTDWCGSYSGALPDRAALEALMRDRPIAVLGINCDASREVAKEHRDKDHVSWPSWFDGGGNFKDLGPIAREFNIDTFPLIYLLDHEGIIRHKISGSPGSDRLKTLIQALADDAAKAATGNSKGNAPR